MEPSSEAFVSRLAFGEGLRIHAGTWGILNMLVWLKLKGQLGGPEKQGGDVIQGHTMKMWTREAGGQPGKSLTNQESQVFLQRGSEHKGCEGQS